MSWRRCEEARGSVIAKTLPSGPRWLRLAVNIVLLMTVDRSSNVIVVDEIADSDVVVECQYSPRWFVLECEILVIVFCDLYVFVLDEFWVYCKRHLIPPSGDRRH